MALVGWCHLGRVRAGLCADHAMLPEAGSRHGLSWRDGTAPRNQHHAERTVRQLHKRLLRWHLAEPRAAPRRVLHGALAIS
jgi:hypothetical protein